MLTLSKKAIAKLEKVKALILEEPRRIDMDVWRMKGETAEAHIRDRFGFGAPARSIARAMPPCGTVGCIAGWLIESSPSLRKQLETSDKDYLNFDFNTIAATALGVERRMDILFDEVCWPPEYRIKLARYRPGTKGYAKVVAARIDHLIKTGE